MGGTHPHKTLSTTPTVNILSKNTKELCLYNQQYQAREVVFKHSI